MRAQLVPSSEVASPGIENIIQVVASCILEMTSYWDAHLCCQFANQAYLDWFGKTQEQMRGIRLQDLHSAELFAKNEPYIRLALAGKEQSFERELIKLNGAVGWVWARYLPHRVNDKVVGFVAVVLDITERKAAEIALHEKTQELDDYFTNALDLFCVANTDGQFLKINQAWTKALGYEPHELEGRQFLDLVHPDDLAATLAAVGSLSEQVPVIDFVNRYRHKNGSWRWIEWRSQPRGNKIFAAARDITERRKMESRVADERSRLETIIDTVGDPIFVKDNDHRVILANKAFYDMFAMEASAVLGRTLAEEVPEGERASFLAVDRKVLDTGLTDEREETLTLAGETRFIVTRKARFIGSSGGMYLVGAIHDITRRKRIAQELAIGRALLDGVIDGSTALIYATDMAGRFLLVNKALEKFYGQTRSTLIGKTRAEALSGVMPSHVVEEHSKSDQALATGGPAHEGEETHMEADGLHHYLTRKYPLRDATGTIFGIAGISIDLTERKRTEVSMEASIREKSALLKEVHHRVKNNLQVITSLLRLEEARSKVEDTKSVLGDMKDRIRAMAVLHESLYRAGTFASVDLGHYLRQLCTQSFRAQSTISGVVRLELNLGSVQVSMDQAIPCGLLINELISNCFKHGFPAGVTGHVRIELQPLDAEHHWSLCVSDTGVGLPENFEEKRKGSLGLQLVDDLAGQLGGELTIAPNQDKGVSFTVNFQALEPEPLVMTA